MWGGMGKSRRQADRSSGGDKAGRPHAVGHDERAAVDRLRFKNKPLSVQGEIISLDDVKEYTILQYVHDPGVPLVGLGKLLFAIGMTLALYFPYKTLRVNLQSKGQGTSYIVGSIPMAWLRNWRGR